MRHEILYQPSYSVARVELEEGEAVMAESGAMVGMSPNIDVDSQMAGGGLLGMVKSAMGGESFFRTTFTAKSAPGEVILAPPSTGDVMAVDMMGGKMYVQRGSYLAGSPDLDISVEASAKGWMSGEGLFLLTVTGHGLLLLSSFGAIHKITLAPGERYTVDTTHIVAFDGTIQYTLDKAAGGAATSIGGLLKGVMKSAMSGEGLVCKYTGPGNIYLQTRSFQSFIKLLMPFLPKKSD
jgi:uncharacterized protein (TIGR00266 family)